MGMLKKGDRVGLLLGETEGEVLLLGFGVYEGPFIPKKGEKGHKRGLPVPRFKLDSGERVFSTECQYHTEDEVKRRLAGKKAVYLDIDSFRRGEA